VNVSVSFIAVDCNQHHVGVNAKAAMADWLDAQSYFTVKWIIKAKQMSDYLCAVFSHRQILALQPRGATTKSVVHTCQKRSPAFGWL
jgi:hypothetical protein